MLSPKSVKIWSGLCPYFVFNWDFSTSTNIK